MNNTSESLSPVKVIMMNKNSAQVNVDMSIPDFYDLPQKFSSTLEIGELRRSFLLDWKEKALIDDGTQMDKETDSDPKFGSLKDTLELEANVLRISVRLEMLRRLRCYRYIANRNVLPALHRENSKTSDLSVSIIEHTFYPFCAALCLNGMQDVLSKITTLFKSSPLRLRYVPKYSRMREENDAHTRSYLLFSKRYECV